MLLEREAVGHTEVRYRVTLYDPRRQWRSAAVVSLGDGAIAFGAWAGEGPPPDWLIEGAAAFLRTLVRAHKRDPDQGWPRRLLRWRAPR